MNFVTIWLWRKISGFYLVHYIATCNSYEVTAHPSVNAHPVIQVRSAKPYHSRLIQDWYNQCYFMNQHAALQTFWWQWWPLESLDQEIVSNRACCWVSHNALFLKTQTHTLTDSRYEFDWVFLEIPMKNCIVGMLLTRPISLSYRLTSLFADRYTFIICAENSGIEARHHMILHH